MPLTRSAHKINVAYPNRRAGSLPTMIVIEHQIQTSERYDDDFSCVYSVEAAKTFINPQHIYSIRSICRLSRHFELGDNRDNQVQVDAWSFDVCIGGSDQRFYYMDEDVCKHWFEFVMRHLTKV